MSIEPIILLLGAIVVVAAIAVVFYLTQGGRVFIGDDEVGLVYKRFSFNPTHRLPTSKTMVASKGEPGWQVETLGPGVHSGYWSWYFRIEKVPQIVIPTGQIGLVIAKVGTSLPIKRQLGKVVECNNYQDARAFLQNGGQRGGQLGILVSGSYQINTKLFEVITAENATQYGLRSKDLQVARVEPDRVGIVTTYDGAAIPTLDMAGPVIAGHNSFQDSQAFIDNGGCQGLQEEILKTGSYNLNPWFVQVEQRPFIEVPSGTVGVIISHIGKYPENSSDDGLVEKDYRGIQRQPLFSGLHALNTKAVDVVIVPTNPIALHWSKDESKQTDNYDAKLRPLLLRSKDGFAFSAEVTQIVQIASKDASKMIASIGSLKEDQRDQDGKIEFAAGSFGTPNHKYGSIQLLLTKVLEPTIGNYFRNSAQGHDALVFHDERTNRQFEAKNHIGGALQAYGVHAVDTLINEIELPPELAVKLRERASTVQERELYVEQQSAEEERQRLERSRSEFEVELARRKADAKFYEAEATAIVRRLENEEEIKGLEAKLAARSKALEAELAARSKALEAEIKAMGPEGYARVREAAERAKIVLPQTIFNGGGGGGGGSLTDLLIAQAMGINLGTSQQQPQWTQAQIGLFIEGLGGYLKAGGAQKVVELFGTIAMESPNRQLTDNADTPEKDDSTDADASSTA